jgi:hypothetical protein
VPHQSQGLHPAAAFRRLGPLKTFLKTDYRGVVAVLEDFAELRQALGLAKVPHYSTLCKAQQRLLQKRGSGDCCDPCSPAPRKTA